MGTLSPRSQLFLISFATLFFEILVIRWVSSEILIFGYFKNLILMGAVLGLGLGCASAANQTADKKGDVAAYFPFLFAIVVFLVSFAGKLGLTGINFIVAEEIFFWLAPKDIVSSVEQLMINVSIVGGIFLLLVSCFDTLGLSLGRQLAKFKPLEAYAINLLGSLAGVVTYSVLAFLHTPPTVWLIVGFASILPFFMKVPQILAMVGCIAFSLNSLGITRWSPYYRIDPIPWMGTAPDKHEYRLGTNLMVNHSSYQRAIDLSEPFLKEHPEQKSSAENLWYNLPYKIIKPQPNNVLILGAGSGNDVAGAVRNGAKHVEAVEIDPIIFDVGKKEHPEHPYADKRVNININDARNFIAQTNQKYDLIVFGFVDSSVSFSMLSSVRLDNFLYTIESLQRTTQLLTPDGIAVLSFAAGPPWLRARLFQMVEAASHQTPMALANTVANKHSITIVWGPGLTPEKRAEIDKLCPESEIPVDQLNKPMPLSTDDWPFLYQRDKSITLAYGTMLVLLMLLASSMTVLRFKLQPSNFLKHSQFFLLGAGFLLLETRGMLSVAVLFGSTWFVNSIVIATILIMALLSNWLVQRFNIKNSYVGYIGLTVGLAVLYLVPMQTFAGLPMLVRIAAAIGVVGLPFIFSGIVFSTAFARNNEPDKALGLNILGALLGGCLEYFSVAIGAKTLIILAFIVYLAAFFAGKLTPAAAPIGDSADS